MSCFISTGVDVLKGQKFLQLCIHKCSLKAAIDQQPHKIALIPCAEAVPLVKLWATWRNSELWWVVSLVISIAPDNVWHERLVIVCKCQLIYYFLSCGTILAVAFAWPSVLLLPAVPLLWLRRWQRMDYWQHSMDASVLQYTHIRRFLRGWTLTQHR